MRTGLAAPARQVFPQFLAIGIAALGHRAPTAPLAGREQAELAARD